MDNRGFIPGIWEVEINVNDFLNLNRNQLNGDLKVEHFKMSIPNDYDLIRDNKKLFAYLKAFHEENMLMYDYDYELFISEEKYTLYTNTSDKKKFMDIGLIVKTSDEERKSFIHPDLCVIPLYGTKYLIKTLKQYIKDLDKQFQTQEWIHRKIENHRSILAIQEFEEFALRQGINVRRPCKNSIEVANVIWLESIYSNLENDKIPVVFNNIFDFIDIFLERDLKNGTIDEVSAQQIIDELYCKLAALQKKNKYQGRFNHSIVLDTSKLNNTTYRLLSSAVKYKEFNAPFQLIFSGEGLSDEIINNLKELFDKEHPLSISKVKDGIDIYNSSLNSSHLFFKSFEDISMMFASFDLYKGLITALNGGKDIATNINVQQVTKGLMDKELSYEAIMNQMELFFKYYITLYTEYTNSYAYYFDMFHNLPFRNSLISSYPYYLMNLSFHNVSSTVKILNAVKKGKFEVVRNDKGFIEKVIPLIEEHSSSVENDIHKIIHQETKRMLFYKNGHFNLVFFEHNAFFEQGNSNVVSNMNQRLPSNMVLADTIKLNTTEFNSYLSNFGTSPYSYIQLYKS